MPPQSWTLGSGPEGALPANLWSQQNQPIPYAVWRNSEQICSITSAVRILPVQGLCIGLAAHSLIGTVTVRCITDRGPCIPGPSPIAASTMIQDFASQAPQCLRNQPVHDLSSTQDFVLQASLINGILDDDAGPHNAALQLLETNAVRCISDLYLGCTTHPQRRTSQRFTTRI